MMIITLVIRICCNKHISLAQLVLNLMQITQRDSTHDILILVRNVVLKHGIELNQIQVGIIRVAIIYAELIVGGV